MDLLEKDVQVRGRVLKTEFQLASELRTAYLRTRLLSTHSKQALAYVFRSRSTQILPSEPRLSLAPLVSTGSLLLSNPSKMISLALDSSSFASKHFPEL